MRSVYVLIAALFLSGCASSFESEQHRLKNSYLPEDDSVPKSGILEKRNGEWSLVFTSSGGNIHYQDGWKPQDNGNNDVACNKGFLGIEGGDRCAQKVGVAHEEWVESEFGASELVFNAFYSPMVTVFGLPFGILSVPSDGGEMLSQFTLPVLVRGHFSYEGFSDAVESAKLNEADSVDSFDKRFASAVARINSLNSEVSDLNSSAYSASEMEEDARGKVEDLLARQRDEIFNSLNLVINDESGLYGEGGERINLRDVFGVSLEEPDVPSFEEVNFKKFVVGHSSLSALEAEVEEKHREFQARKEEVERLEQVNKARYEAFVEDLQEYNSSVNYEMSKFEVSGAGEYEWDLPEIGIRDNALRGDRNVVLTVKNVVRDNIMPGSFAVANEQLSLEQRGDKIVLENRSTDYVSIEAISLYFGDKIRTIGVREGFIELPPQSRHEHGLSSFEIDDLAPDFRALTAEKAAVTSMSYGFAVRFTTTNTTEQKRLFKTENIRVIDML